MRGEMPDDEAIPDIFVDGVSVGTGPFGIVLMLLRSNPTPPPEVMANEATSGTADLRPANRLVGRLRITDGLARRLIGQLQSAVMKADALREEGLAAEKQP